MKDATLSGKRKYDELSEKNIPFETKRNIHEKKRKFLREKKEKKKQKKTDSTITKKTTNEKERSNIDPFATPTKVNSHSTACTPATSNSLNPVYTFEASGINVYSYAESRAYEILNLKNALNDANFGPNKQVFQRLPRHMRRRAASHDVRRLPKRLRSKAANENVETKKAPSRKYKRKPRNLIKEYNQRSALNAWLETHMWHAKRFKMVDKWGYRVPQKPCDKSFRALYRASAKSCVLQDQSYTEFIKISGSKETILSGFRKLTNPNVIGGLQLDNEKCLSGDCYGEELIYSHDRYPYNVIGTVKFIWADRGGGTMIHSELMVLCHPSIAMQLVHELDVVFNAVKDDTSDKSCLQEEVEMDVNLCISEQSNQNDTAAVINVIHHKLDFNLFSLTGPLSFQILQRALTLTNETKSDSGESIWNPSVELRDENCSIHNLVVEDPRFHIPYKKENPLTAGQENNVLTAMT